jgi:hypothetical protein
MSFAPRKHLNSVHRISLDECGTERFKKKEGEGMAKERGN